MERTFSSGMLSLTTTFRLCITGPVEAKQIDALIRILTLQKQLLENDDVETPNAVPEKDQALSEAEHVEVTPVLSGVILSI